VHAFVAICLLAATSNGPDVHAIKFAEPPVTKPAIVQASKGTDRLTLYNANGDRVAKCDKQDGKFSNCKMEPGMTFDDVMNAWAHAYEDIQTR
jgi:hypothetical protein